MEFFTVMNSTEEADVMFLISVDQLIKEDPVGFTDTIRRQIDDVIWKFEEAETLRLQVPTENENISRTRLVIPTHHNVEIVQTIQAEVDVLGSRRLEDEEPIEMNQQDDLLSRSGNCNATQPEDVEQQPLMLLRTVEMFPSSSDRRPLRHHKNNKNQIDQTGMSGHECPECRNIFKTKTHLKTHSWTHLDMERRKKIRDSWKFQCKMGVCKRKFKWNSKLQTHRLSHLDQKHFKCTECDKHFQTPQTMKEHRKVHKEDCPNKCYFCNKKFSANVHLNQHLKIHTGEMDFNCEICSKEFNHKQNLKSHVEFVHQKLRPHECPSCPKKFTQKGGLVKHFHAIH